MIKLKRYGVLLGIALTWLSLSPVVCVAEEEEHKIDFSRIAPNLPTGAFFIAQSTIPPPPPPPAPTADIKANGSDGPISINYNTAATLGWTSTYANYCTLNGSAVAVSGSQTTGNLTASQTFNLACSGAGGNASDSVTVNVNPPPPVASNLSGSASPTSVVRGGTSIITAIVRDQFGAPMAGVSVSFSVPTQGSVAPTSAVTGAGGQASATFTAPQNFPGQSIPTGVYACVSGLPCRFVELTVTKK